MSEISKLYENAGIKPYIYCSKPQLDCNARETGNCKQDCEYYSGERLLTSFTAEKQLELIKWLMCKKQTIQVELRLYENDYCISHITECEDNDAVEYVETGRINTFDEALADLINELWQDLTEEEKQQVKGILE